MRLFTADAYEGRSCRGNALTISGLVICGALAILFLDHLFAPALINLLEAVTGKIPTMEVVIRAHFLVVFLQILLIIFFLLFIHPAKDFRKRIVLYFLMVEGLILCSIWIFDKPGNYFYTERSALTFFSALFLMLCSLVAFVNALSLNYQAKPSRLAKPFWMILTVAFFLAAMDEFFMVHEKISDFTKGGNLADDLATASYAVGACLVVGSFYKLFRNNGFSKNSHFFKLLLSAIATLVLAVSIDTFDYLFRFMNPYFSMFDLLNSMEELLEFTAATLFLCAFVLNLFEADDGHLLKLTASRIQKYEPGKYLKIGYAVSVSLAAVFFLGIRIVYSVEDEPVILEKGFEVSVFADTSDGLSNPDGIAYDRDLGLFVGNGGKVNNILLFDKDGQGRVFADARTGLNSPEGLGVRGKALFVADDSGGKVLRYDAAEGSPSVVAEKGLKSPDGLALDSAGNLYIGDEKLALVIKQTGDHREVLASSLDGLRTPEEIAIDDQGNLYITDEMAQAVFRISPSGKTTTFADKSNGLVSPEGITFHDGRIYVTDSAAGIIYRFDQEGAGGKFLTFSKKHRTLLGIAMDEQDNLYVVSSDPYSASGFIFRVELGE